MPYCIGTHMLRWVNQLRGDLVTGAFTPEEDQRIVELQATLGNKWSSIARELSGRWVRAVVACRAMTLEPLWLAATDSASCFSLLGARMGRSPLYQLCALGHVSSTHAPARQRLHIHSSQRLLPPS